VCVPKRYTEEFRRKWVLDTFSRRVVGWSIDFSQTAALVTNALSMAISNRDPQAGGVIHSDHGVQLTSWAFTDRAKRSGLVQSMGSIGDCLLTG
jgi:putative transposase